METLHADGHARARQQAMSIRPYRAGDEVTINEGFNATFGLTRTLEEWHWKFPADPVGRWIMLAVDDAGRAVAHYAAVPVIFQVDDVRVLAGQGVDAFSLPEVRGERVYSRTLRTFHDAYMKQGELELGLVFPGERNARIFASQAGYETLGKCPVWRREASRRCAWRTAHDVVETSPGGPLDELWRSAAARYPVAAVRDAAWLRRRFTGRPGVEYVHLAATRAGRTAAWAVVRADGDLVHWAELIWDGRDVRALAALDRAVVRFARRAGARSVDLWLGGDTQAEVALADLGWRRFEPRKPFYVQVLVCRADVSVSSVRDRLYITKGDADLV